MGKLDCQNEMIRTCLEKARGRCSDANMEVGGHQTIGTSQLRRRDAIQKDMKEAGV